MNFLIPSTDPFSYSILNQHCFHGNFICNIVHTHLYMIMYEQLYIILLWSLFNMSCLLNFFTVLKNIEFTK